MYIIGCEDDYYSYLVLNKFLSQFSRQIHSINYVLFSSGRRLLEHIENNFLIDLLILDLRLEDEDGINIIDTIRNNLNRQFPILVMTALNGNNIQKSINSGATDYLQKPITRENFNYKITELSKLK